MTGRSVLSIEYRSGLPAELVTLGRRLGRASPRGGARLRRAPPSHSRERTGANPRAYASGGASSIAPFQRNETSAAVPFDLWFLAADNLCKTLESLTPREVAPGDRSELSHNRSLEQGDQFHLNRAA